MKLVFTDEATADLREIVLCLEDTDLTSGPFQTDLSDALEHLRRWPESGARRDDLTRNRKIRFWLVEPFHLAYLAGPDRVITIVGIIHASRDIRRVLRKRLGKNVHD